MKYSIIVKFLAVLLCAAALLGAVGSAAGILAVTELGLYEKTFRQVYTEELEETAYILADSLATRHAAMNLGGCNAQIADQLMGNPWSYNLDYANIGYVLLDGDGEVLQSSGLPESAEVDFSGSFEVGGQYIKVLRTVTETEKHEEDMATVPVEGAEDIQVLVLREEDADIYSLTVGYTNGESESHTTFTEPLGRLTRQENGNFLLVCNGDFGNMELFRGSIPEYVRMEDRDGQIVYHAINDRGSAVLHCACDGGSSYVILSGGTEQPEPLLLDNLPADGAAASSVTLSYADGSSESVGGAPEIGVLFYDEEGRVIFVAHDAAILDVPEMTVTYIAFLDEAGYPLYEARDAAGVGRFYTENGTLYFRADPESASGVSSRNQPDAVTVEETGEEAPACEETSAPQGTDAASETAAAPMASESAAEPTVQFTTETPVPNTVPEEALSVTQPLPSGVEADAGDASTEVTELMPAAETEERSMAAAGIYLSTYYDHDLDENMVVEYTYEEMPTYTVEVIFAPGALRDDYAWRILGWAYAYRQDLPLLLVVSLLVFAVMAVYLCCAAGRKPGVDTVRAGGLNALPLDLYLGLGTAAFVGILFLGVEGARHLLPGSVKVGAAYALLAGFAACLLVVAFCFACAAQFKTPGGYWWRNCLCGRCLGLLARCWRRLTKNFCSRVLPGLGRLLRACWKLTKFFWGLLTRAGSWLLRLLRRGGGWVSGKLLRFFALLPVTWQWMLTGFVLVFWLLVAVAGRYEGLMLLWLCAALAAVIYGAHCFGTLLDSTKRMRKGDLDEKVDDRLLIGSFREFADELNGLADVAVVAARKQLKSERMKTELITNVSHDIKTPLTSIINYVDLLKKAQTQAEREACLEVLDRQSLRLKKLVEDLMEMSKASTGNLAVDIQRVDAAEAINQALGEFSDKLEKARLIPVFRQPEAPVEMLADGRLVWRVLSNLLGNAVKYALPGTRVYLDLAQVEDKVVISMKNISREELNVQADELLERFVRGDASRNTEGSGLGLNIAKSLMELQRGQLQLLVDGDLFKVTLIFPGV